MRHQRDFDASGFVSIWLGDFSDEERLDDYLQGAFQGDFGFEIYPPTGPEYDISEDGPVPVRQLIDGCFLSERYLDDAVELCKSRGWTEATSLLLFLHMRYDPAGLTVNPDAPMAFVGTVALRPK